MEARSRTTHRRLITCELNLSASTWRRVSRHPAAPLSLARFLLCLFDYDTIDRSWIPIAKHEHTSSLSMPGSQHASIAVHLRMKSTHERPTTDRLLLLCFTSPHQPTAVTGAKCASTPPFHRAQCRHLFFGNSVLARQVQVLNGWLIMFAASEQQGAFFFVVTSFAYIRRFSLSQRDGIVSAYGVLVCGLVIENGVRLCIYAAFTWGKHTMYIQ